MFSIMTKKFYRVGECFDTPKGRVVAVTDTRKHGFFPCMSCALSGRYLRICQTVACLPYERIDHRSVHFELLNDNN